MYFIKYVSLAVLSGLMFCFAACNQRPKGVLDREKMAQVILHMIMVDEYINHYLGVDSLAPKLDSIRGQKYLDVLALHHIDSAGFSKSLNWYKRGDKELSGLIDSLNALVSREREKRFVPMDLPKSDSLAKVEELTLDSSIKDN